MIRFQAGFSLAAIQQVTVPGAIIRTSHAVVGYGLFATVVGLAAILIRDRAPTCRPIAMRRSAPVEALA
jgi:hypothetical protein